MDGFIWKILEGRTAKELEDKLNELYDSVNTEDKDESIHISDFTFTVTQDKTGFTKYVVLMRYFIGILV